MSGMRTTVTCDVQMGDPPMTLTWLRDGRPLVPTTDLQLSQHDSFSSSLILTHVRPPHAGNYTCVARNEAREVSYTAQLLVRGNVLRTEKALAPARTAQHSTAQHSTLQTPAPSLNDSLSPSRSQSGGQVAPIKHIVITTALTPHPLPNPALPSHNT